MKTRSQTLKRVLSFVMAFAMILTLLPTAVFAVEPPTTLYLKPNSNWTQANAWFAGFFWGGSGDNWATFTDSDSDGVYECQIPGTGHTSFLILRKNPANTGLDWDGEWNRIGDQTLPTDGNNCVVMANGTWDGTNLTWTHVHSYTATVTAPDCTTGGYTTYTCTCGDSYTGDETDAAGHQFEDGTCTVCGAADPDYTPPVVVAYLAGAMNGWSTTETPIYAETGATVTLEAGTYEFKIVRDGAWYGNNGTIQDTTTATSDVGWEMSTSAGNCKLAASGGDYTFLFNPDNNYLVITYGPADDGDPTPSEPEEPEEPVLNKVLYLKPNSNWAQANARFAAYFFGNGETWISMTDADGDGYYEVTAPEGYPNVIFCRMNPSTSANNWDNKWNQSSDLTVPTDDKNCYTVAEGAWDKGSGTWSVYTPSSGGGEGGDEPAPTPSEYYLAGYLNNADYEGTDYKFENGTLTVTFTNDSYVYITTDVGTAYKAQSYISDVTGTFYNSTTGAGEKMFVPGGVELTFTLVVNEDDTLTLSYSVTVIEEPVTEFTIHFRNTGLWDAVYYHAWIEMGADDEGLTGDWPGFAMTEDTDHTNWYTVTLSGLNAENGVGILFNNNGQGAQTSDIMITADGEYWYDGKLLTEAPTSWPDGSVRTVSYEATFHFANSLKWSNVNLYTWTSIGTNPNGGWPGQTCNMVDGFYTLTVTYEAPEGQGLNFIFNNGSIQTADLELDASAFTLDAETDVYKAEKWVALTTTDSEGKYNADIVDHPEAIAFSPVVNGSSVTFQYRDAEATKLEVFGSMNEWASGYEMTCNDYGVWTVTVENIGYGIHEYKFVVNGTNWVTDPLNSWSQNDNSAFLISNPELDTNTVTINVHYDAPSTEWNVYAWGTGLADQFDFVDDVATIILEGRAHQYVSFKVRQSIGSNHWVKESSEVNVNLSNIVSGTIDVYVTYDGESWSSSQAMNNDVVTANKISSVELDYDNGTVIITTTEPVNDPETAFAVEGATITDIAVSGSTYTLTLEETLDLVTLYQYTVRFSEQVKFTDYAYAIGTSAVYASDKFAEEFTYEGTDLGSTYTSTGTTFVVWAPTAEAVSVKLYSTGSDAEDGAAALGSHQMTKGENGIWTVTVSGDLKNLYYTYSVTRSGETVEACDPYARATGVNGQRAMILDLDSTDPENWESDSNPNPITSYTDAVIYELHVRDFSIDDSSGVSEANRGKYLAFTEEGTTTSAGVSTGIDYLDELGITHLHLLPIYDYGSVDETTSNSFNWGYDPVNYNVPEGSYSTNPYDGSVRVNEMKQMVQSLHEHDISVVMDVVYNHVYDSGKFCFNQIVPGYFSRVNSNTSGCGNDTASEREMVRKYIVESVLYWTEEYHIDGFRFDLVGLLDVETINQIVTEVHKIRPDVIFYGEGWDMDGTNKEPGTQMAKQHNADKTPGFAYFSDSMRNLIAGDNGNSKGFVSGLTGREEQLANDFMAKPTSWGSAWTNNPQQVVQYVSCHDNYTLVDKLILSTGKSAIDDDIIRMNNLSAAIYMTAQGIPFIHAGEELLREKINSDGSRNHNSYNASDDVNHIEWSNLEKEAYAETSDYYKGLIEFRKAHAGLRLDSAAEIAEHVKYTWVTNEVVMFTINAEEDISDSIIVIFNATDKAQEVKLPEGEWNICINGTTAGTESLGTVTSTASVAGISALVLVQGETCNHNWKDATCTEPKTCTICGETEGTVADHIPGEAVKENVVDSTCTAEGFYDEVVYCTECEEELSRETKNTDKIDHTPGEAVKENEVEATCTKEGSYDEVIYCAECEQELSRETVTVEKLAHEYKDGKCENCGEEDPDYVAPAEDEVIRIFGENRFATAFKVADEMKAVLGIEKFNTIIIASGDDFADALGGSYLANVKSAPILLSYNDEYNAKVADYIKANLAQGGTVYILGGTAAVPETMEAGLAGINVKRLAGANRFETNLEILKEAGVGSNEILVCTATNFADSLSASVTGKPILLVWNEKGELYGKQPEFLAGLSGNTFCVIGGESAVCAELETAVSAYGKTVRLAGANRFVTSVMVAERYFGETEAVVLAYAKNYPDGLCGGALAYAMKAPLVLTMTGYEATAAEYAKTEGVTSGIVLGGTGLISDEAVRTVFQMEAADEIIVK